MPLGLGAAPIGALDLFGRSGDLIAAGQAFRVTTGQIATGGTNAWVALQGVLNNAAKHVYIYSILVWDNASSSDVRVYTNPGSILTDAGLTANMLTNIQNQLLGSAVASVLSILNASPGATTQASPANMGNLAIGAGCLGNSTQQLLQNGSGLWIPKATQGTFWIGAIQGTSGNKVGITMEWVEF